MSDNSYIYGRNSVRELLNSDVLINEIFYTAGNKKGSIIEILEIAHEKNIKLTAMPEQMLSKILGSAGHQGIAAAIEEIEYVSVDEILDLAREKDEEPFLIIADGIEDPHNLGALIRTADAAGAHGLIIPKHRSASVTATVFKTSAGASAHLPVSMVTNLSDTLKYLKSQGIWSFGADMDGEVLWKTNLAGPVVLIVGSEGKGISKHLKLGCDVIVSLPMKGKVSSLNASVAGGILMYEVVRTRFLK